MKEFKEVIVQHQPVGCVRLDGLDEDSADLDFAGTRIFHFRKRHRHTWNVYG
jgi:hypothetical protein